MTVPPPPPYGSPMQPAPPAKKRFFTLPKILIAVGIVVVLCCGGLALGGYKLFDTVRDAVTPARDAAAAFLDDVEDGDDAAAYALFCDSMKQISTESQFESRIEQRGRPKDHKITGVSVNSTNGRTSGTVTATLTLADGSTKQTIIVLAKEGDTWKVCSNPL